MKKKSIIVFVIVFLLLITLVASSKFSDSVFVSGNIFYTGSWTKDSSQSALTGWYLVQDWEVQTCSRDVTASFKPVSQSSSGALSSNALIVDTALTMQAYQYIDSVNTNHHEYELAWYIHPLLEPLDYEIQMYTQENGWQSLDLPIKKTAKPSYGDSGYQTWEGDYNMSLVRIITKDSSLEVEVMNK